MSGMAAWKTLVPGSASAGTVLAIDFDATGRQEARFSDLAANLVTYYTVWEAVPAIPADGSDYLDSLTCRLAADRPPVRALLGFCAGAVYAAALAERIALWQDDVPQLLLFDPELSVPQTLLWQFHKVVGLMSAMLSEGEIAAARAAGTAAYEADPDVDALTPVLMRLVREYGQPAFTRAGLDRARREELFEVFGAFMHYLAQAGRIDPLATWEQAIVFSSNSPLGGMRGMRSAGADVKVAKEIPIDVDHATLLADPGLAGMVSDLLGTTTVSR